MDDTELRFSVQRFLAYVADVRAGRVRRLDRDVVLSFATDIETALVAPKEAITQPNGDNSPKEGHYDNSRS